jgi:proteic killer suppression protein
MPLLTERNGCRYYSLVIQSFRDKDTEKLFRRERAKVVPPNIQRVALRKLVQLDAAAKLQDLKVPPGNRLEALSGHRAGQFSIRINDQWRICFVWKDGHAHQVEIVDYH